MKRFFLWAAAFLVALVVFAAPAQAASDGTPVYRALLVGNKAYATTLNGPENDVTRMTELLKNTCPSYHIINARRDLTSTMIQNSVQALRTSGIDGDDVTLFYFSGHGSASGIVGVDGRIVRFTTLADVLSSVPGAKIVIFDSCYSGASIGRSVESKFAADNTNGMEMNVQSAIDAFSNTSAKPDMAQGGFYVLASCSGSQTSLSVYDGAIWGGAMTYLYAYGCGMDYETLEFDEELSADSDRNNMVSLTEAQNYINRNANDIGWTQVAKIYPTNSSYPLFARKILVTKLTLSATQCRIARGETVSLSATVTPSYATDTAVTWTSSNASVATVSGGTVRGVSSGTAIITARTANGISATCTVSVSEPVAAAAAAASIRVSQNSLTLYTGATSTLSASVSPAKMQSSVSWTSGNPAVATVSDGVITTHMAGSAYITAMCGNAASSCLLTVVDPVIPATSMELTMYSCTIVQGETASIFATVYPLNASDRNVVWSSGNEGAAYITGNTIVAVAPGMAYITATGANGLVASCLVTVQAVPSAVSLNSTAETMNPNDQLTLTATIHPADAYEKSRVWSSSNAAVARVDAYGKVTAVSTGRAVITVTVNGRVSAQCDIVVASPVKRIRMSASRATLYPGNTYQLTAKTTPDAQSAKALFWSSSNAAVATVDDNGVVTAISAGKAVISASSINGVTARSTFTVKNRQVRLNRKSAKLYELQSLKLRASVTPAKTAVTWSTSNASVATVDNGTVALWNAGTAVITARMEDGTSASCTVTVRPRTLRMNRTKLSVYVGKSAKLTARAQVNQTGIAWSSSNSAVAAVDASGRVSAIAAGDAVITARLSNGQTASCTVTVKPVKVSGVRLSKSSAKLTRSTAIDLTATVRPANATDTRITFTSSNPAIASVDENGYVTAMSAGSAYIYATNSASGRTARCKITVVNS